MRSSKRLRVTGIIILFIGFCIGCSMGLNSSSVGEGLFPLFDLWAALPAWGCGIGCGVLCFAVAHFLTRDQK